MHGVLRRTDPVLDGNSLRSTHAECSTFWHSFRKVAVQAVSLSHKPVLEKICLQACVVDDSE